MPLNFAAQAAISALTIFLAGCAYFRSWDDSSRLWIGDAIAKYVAIQGPPTSITEIDNDVTEYKFALTRVDPKCVHYWLVNKAGVIVSYRFEG